MNIKSLFFITLSLLAACSSTGTIAISEPRVYTRERLLASRAREVQFLEKKLGTAFVPSIQGYRDVRTFTGFYNNLSVNIDPSKARLADALVRREIENTRGQTRLDRLREQVEYERTLKEYEALKNSEEGATSETKAGVPAATSRPTASSASPSSVLGFSDSASAPALPDPQNRRDSKAKNTGLEELQDELAYRNAVRHAIQELELDDTHDLNGHTLYTLTFDLSLLPPNFTKINSGKSDNSWWTQDQDPDLFGRVAIEVIQQGLNPRTNEKQRRMSKVEALRTLSQQMQLQFNAEVDDASARILVAENVGELVHVFQEWQVLTSELKSLSDRLGNLEKQPLLKASELTKLKKEYSSSVLKSDLTNAKEYLSGLSFTLNGVGNPISAINELFSDKFIDRLKLAENASADATRNAILTSFRGDIVGFDAKQQVATSIGKSIDDLTSSASLGTKQSSAIFTTIKSSVENSLKPIVAPTLFENTSKAFQKLINSSSKYKNGSKASLSDSDRQTLVSAIPYILAHRYQRQLRGLVHLNLTIDAKSNEELNVLPYPVVTFKSTFEKEGVWESLALEQCEKLLKKLKMNDSVKIYSVEPKQYAQNISEVAASESLIRMIASLQATLPAGAASNQFEYIRRSQKLVEATSREPLAVGFVDGKSKFGWLLGPRFVIKDADNADVGFRWVPTQYQVSVTLSVPSWWKELTYHEVYDWRGRDGAIKEATQVKSYISSEPIPVSHSVRLPGDSVAFAKAIYQLRATANNNPVIKTIVSPPIRLGQEDVTVLIRGEELWRRPQIFLGQQKADKYEILPDMRGLYVTFNKIKVIETLAEKGERVDLTIVTSNAATHRPNAILVLPAEKAPEKMDAPKVSVELQSVALVASDLTGGKSNVAQRIEIHVTKTLVPTSFSSLELTVSNPGIASELFGKLTSREPVNDKIDKLIFVTELAPSAWDTWLGKLKLKHLTGVNSINGLHLGLKLQEKSGSKSRDIWPNTISRDLLYVSSKDLLGFNIKSVKASSKGAKERVELSHLNIDLLEIYRPGLKQSISDGNLLIRFSDIAKPPVKSSFSISNVIASEKIVVDIDNSKLTIKVPTEFKVPATDKTSLQYKNSVSKKLEVIPVKGP